MTRPKKILVIDDEMGARESLRIILDSDYQILTASNYSEGLNSIEKENPDLILLDIMMPGKTGLDLLEMIRSKGLENTVIMVTATQTIKTVVQAMKLGAVDYITKPFDVEEIKAVIKENISSTHQKPNHQAKGSFPFTIESVIGYNTTLKSTFKLAKRLSQTQSTVLITGESGTGKELIARSIHKMSSYEDHPFIPVHLSAMSENLLESELFGHVKGSFTGANNDRDGAFQAAGKGTIFLDEIGEINEQVQIKLLRVLQEKEFKRIGDNKILKTQARVIAATNKNLYKMVEEGSFRADLYYRLKVVPIELPPLRNRLTDIDSLTHFLAKKISSKLGIDFPTIDEELIEAFKSYPWPGNIRELENTLENMLLLSDENALTLKELPYSLQKDLHIDSVKTSLQPKKRQSDNLLESIEKETIQMALMENNGVLTSTAKYLGTTRRILKYKMDKLGISKTDWLCN